MCVCMCVCVYVCVCMRVYVVCVVCVWCVCVCMYIEPCVHVCAHAADEEALPVDVKELAKDLRMAASELVGLLDVNSATMDRLKVRLRECARESVPTI